MLISFQLNAVSKNETFVFQIIQIIDELIVVEKLSQYCTFKHIWEVKWMHDNSFLTENSIQG